MAKRKKNTSRSIWLTVLGFSGLALVVTILLVNNDVILFNPKGLIASEQNRLMVVSTFIMLGFGIPVVATLYFFAWKYRETGKKAIAHPKASRGNLPVIAFWGLPTVIMLVLASIMIPATFRLEPQDTIEAEGQPLTIQVVALRWKWLFMYPEQNIATVNYVEIPVNTPVQFELTADETPMSSFWIPHLGGQLYAMTEHINRLNLMADTLGDYEGSAAEINGPGFAGMRFTTRVSTQKGFERWVAKTKRSVGALGMPEYEKLLRPSENHKTEFYASRDPELYSTIVSKYAGSHSGSHSTDRQIQQYEVHH